MPQSRRVVVDETADWLRFLRQGKASQDRDILSQYDPNVMLAVPDEGDIVATY